MEKLFVLLAKTVEETKSRYWQWSFSGHDKSFKILHFPITLRSKPIEAVFWLNTQEGIDAAIKFITDQKK